MFAIEETFFSSIVRQLAMIRFTVLSNKIVRVPPRPRVWPRRRASENCDCKLAIAICWPPPFAPTRFNNWRARGNFCIRAVAAAAVGSERQHRRWRQIGARRRLKRVHSLARSAQRGSFRFVGRRAKCKPTVSAEFAACRRSASLRPRCAIVFLSVNKQLLNCKRALYGDRRRCGFYRGPILHISCLQSVG